MNDKVSVYNLKYTNGDWLGRIVITDDGFIGSVTDYGNFSYSWQAFGENFKEFLLSLNDEYFASKMYNGISYVCSGRKVESACNLFAEKILPKLKEAIKQELYIEQLEIGKEYVVSDKYKGIYTMRIIDQDDNDVRGEITKITKGEIELCSGTIKLVGDIHVAGRRYCEFKAV